MLSDQQIREFQNLYQQECGESIDTGNARAIATQLVDLVRAVYRPYKPEHDSRKRTPAKQQASSYKFGLDKGNY